MRVKGDAGEMTVVNPYHPHWFYRMKVHTSKGTRGERVVNENIYALQLRTFAKAIRGEMTLNTEPEDAVNNMRVIDAIYEKAGLKRRRT